MRVNDINSKVNLPKFCQNLGIKGYQYVKLPIFGWFAYNSDRSFVGNIYDLIPFDEHNHLYKLIVKDKPGYLDFNISYSEVAEQRLNSNLKTTQLFRACYNMAKQEALGNPVIKYEGKNVPIFTLFEELGLPNLVGKCAGVITKKVMNEFGMINWPKGAMDQLLIPTYCTPRHICSLEMFKIAKQIKAPATIYVNEEKGWYGNLSDLIVPDVATIASTGGNTWDYKCDYWYENIVAIHDQVNVSDLIKIWVEAKNTTFKKSPAVYIAETGRADEIKNYLTNLSYNQILELEKITGKPLTEHWQKARDVELQFGGQTYLKRDNCYYIVRKNGIQQLTNFTLDIDEIIKHGDKYTRKGHLYYKDKVFPVEIDDKFFYTHYKFRQAINQKFFDMGIGVPLINAQFEYMIVQIISCFNENATLKIADS